MSRKKTRAIKLTQEQCELLRSALDSHQYWQLSEEHYRNSGFVMEPGSDDPEVAAEIEACDELAALLAEPEARR